MKKFESLNREQLNLFKQNSENRLINHGHKNRIKKQMVEFLDNFGPITVNQRTNNIIDGQHRWIAFIELVDEGKLPNTSTFDVKYLDIPEEKEKEAIVNANIINKNWSLDDYIFSFSKTNKDYAKLIDWCANHTLCTDGKKYKYRYGAAMLKGESCSKKLKSGVFELCQEDIERAELVHAELIDILEILGKKMSNPFMEALAISWINVRHLHPYSVWRKEIKTKKNMLMKKPSENQKEWDSIFSLVSTAIQIKK